MYAIIVFIRTKVQNSVLDCFQVQDITVLQPSAVMFKMNDDKVMTLVMRQAQHGGAITYGARR